MAMISLDLASHACWPSTSRWPATQAETRCVRLPCRGCAREVLPSLATISGLASSRPASSCGLAHKAGHPSNEAGGEQLAIDGIEDVVERVVARNAAGVEQETAKEAQVQPRSAADVY